MAAQWILKCIDSFSILWCQSYKEQEVTFYQQSGPLRILVSGVWLLHWIPRGIFKKLLMLKVLLSVYGLQCRDLEEYHASQSPRGVRALSASQEFPVVSSSKSPVEQKLLDKGSAIPQSR